MVSENMPHQSRGSRKRSFNMKNLDIALNTDFQRMIVKEKNGEKLIFVYYVGPNGAYYKDMDEISSWVAGDDNKNGLVMSNFSFVARKMTDNNNEIICAFESVPDELTETMGKKAMLLMREDKGDINSADETISDFPPPKKAIMKTPSETSDVTETTSTLSDDREVPKQNIIYRPMMMPDRPLASISFHNIFEDNVSCHLERLKKDLTSGMYVDMIAKDLIPVCSSFCAFDENGKPRVAVECDICLILWHTDCMGFRILTANPLSLIICDNCFLVQKKLNLEAPNTMCDIEQLFVTEYKNDETDNGEIKIPATIEPILKLCKFSWMKQRPNVKFMMDAYKHQQSDLFKRVEIPKQIEVQKAPESPKQTSMTIGPLLTTPIRGTTTDNFQNIQPKKTADVWRHCFRLAVSFDNIIRELKDEYIRLKFNTQNIDQLAQIFADPTCKLLLDQYPADVILSRIVIRNGELIIPISCRILKPCVAKFYTVENTSTSNVTYQKKYQELKTAMLTSYYQQSNMLPKLNASKNNNFSMVKKLNPQITVQQIATATTVTSTAATTSTTTAGIKATVAHPVTLVKQSRYVLHKPKSNGSTLPTLVLPQTPSVQSFSKMRNRKQHFVTETKSNKVTTYMHNAQFNFNNLPFVVLEKILSSTVLSVQDKLNCRLVNRLMKCVIDGGRVWNNIVILTDSFKEMEKAITLWQFLMSKPVSKLIVLIDLDKNLEWSIFDVGIKNLSEKFRNIRKLSLQIFNGSKVADGVPLSIQSLLSSFPTLDCLSINSEHLITLSNAGDYYLTSNSLKKLKIRNVDNIQEHIITTESQTPNLQILCCGDWSNAQNVNYFPLNHVSDCTLLFKHFVQLKDASGFLSLNNLRTLSISKPVVSEGLFILLTNVLSSLKLKRVNLTTICPSENFELCKRMMEFFPKNVLDIRWKLIINKNGCSGEHTANFLHSIQQILTENIEFILIERG